MNKKSWLAVLFFILIIIIGLWAWMQYRKVTPTGASVSVPQSLPTLTALLPDFPANVPVPAGVEILAYQHTVSGNVSHASFQYVSTSTLTSVIKAYTNFFTLNNWTTKTLPSPAGSQAINATENTDNLLVTAMTDPATKKLVVSLAITTTTVSPFPVDFPSETGFTPADSIATSSKSQITYDRMYTSKQSLSADYQIFTTYFTKNGYKMGPGPFNTATSKSMVANKLNASYEVVLVEDPKTTTVYVDVRLTFYK